MDNAQSKQGEQYFYKKFLQNQVIMDGVEYEILQCKKSIPAV
jgi:hypothetical protein